MGFKKQTPDYIATCEVDKLLANMLPFGNIFENLIFILNMAE